MISNVFYLKGPDSDYVAELEALIEAWRQGEIKTLVVMALREEGQDDAMFLDLEEPPVKLAFLFGFMEVLREKIMRRIYPGHSDAGSVQE